MSLGNKGGVAHRNGLRIQWLERKSCKYSNLHATYLRGAAGSCTHGFIIPDGLFVHNIKGHLELATVRDQKLPEECARKGWVRRWPVTRESGAAGPSC